MLRFTMGATVQILEAKDLKAIERHVSALDSIMDKTHQLKLQVQELQIGHDAVEVRLWTEGLETQTKEFKEVLKEIRDVATSIRPAEEEKHEEKWKRILHEEIENEKAKFEMRAKLKKVARLSPEVSDNASTVGAKLPKLEISKFQGTYSDWIIFWNQFKTEIDKAKLTQVAKFSYLKELLVPSVHSSIDDFLSRLKVTKEPKLY